MSGGETIVEFVLNTALLATVETRICWGSGFPAAAADFRVNAGSFTMYGHAPATRDTRDSKWRRKETRCAAACGLALKSCSAALSFFCLL